MFKLKTKKPAQVLHSLYTSSPVFSKIKLINIPLGEFTCTYIALILHDKDIRITAKKISALAKAANVTVLLSRETLVMNVGAGSRNSTIIAAAPTGWAAVGVAPGATATEEKKRAQGIM